jgi:hypothetical protein
MNEQSKTNDVELDIQQYINLKNIVGNRHAAEMATAYIDDFYNTKENCAFLKPILLVGRNSCTTMARAISNAFGNGGNEGNENFYYACGSFFSAGICELNNYYAYNGDGCCSTYYISNIDKLNTLNQFKLGRIFYECRINYIDRETKLPISAPLRKHLHILSAQAIGAISKPLLDQMGLVINLTPLTEEEIFQVLEQRIKLMNLKVEPDTILSKIAQGCAGLVNKAIEIFSLACCLMRAEDEYTLTKKYVDRALYLEEKNTDTYLRNELL